MQANLADGLGDRPVLSTPSSLPRATERFICTRREATR